MLAADSAYMLDELESEMRWRFEVRDDTLSADRNTQQRTLLLEQLKTISTTTSTFLSWSIAWQHEFRLEVNLCLLVD